MAADVLEVDIPDGDRLVTCVRLRGIAGPEIAHPAGGHDAYFGREAADFVQEHVEGQRVTITLDPNRGLRGEDGCVLAYLSLSDTGESLNELLLAEGLAFADGRTAHVLSVRFQQLENRARRARRGLWLRATPEQLPDWRRRREPASNRPIGV
jgi:endonuclease YncB( thermonuclease family)